MGGAPSKVLEEVEKMPKDNSAIELEVIYCGA
jgi:hypothetical protein